MFCLQKLRQAVLLFFVTCLFCSQSVVAGLGSSPQTAPPVDLETMLRMLKMSSDLPDDDDVDGKARPVINKSDILPPQQTMEYLFGELEGLEGQLVVADRGMLKFSIRNGKEGIALNDMKLNFVATIAPYRGKARLRIKEPVARTFRADDDGVLNIAVPLDDFYHSMAQHYNLSLYYLTGNHSPVLIKNADFSLVYLPSVVSSEFETLEDQYRVTLNQTADIGDSEEQQVTDVQQSVEAEKGQVYLEALKTAQTKRALVLDVSKLPQQGKPEQVAGHVGKVRKLLRETKGIGESADFRIIVTADGKPVDGIGRVPTYPYIHKEYYDQVLAPVFLKLRSENEWDITLRDLSDDDIDSGASEAAEAEPVEFLSKQYLEDGRGSRQQVISKLVRVEDSSYLTFRAPGGEKSDGKIAQVYITPLTEKFGFQYEEGDAYKVQVSDGRIDLSVSVAELHKKSWQYQVDIIVPTDDSPLEHQVKLIAVDKNNIDHVSAVFFNKSSHVGAGSPLLKQLDLLPVCENGKDCPLLAVYKPDANKPARGDIPSYAAIVVEDYVDEDIFKGVGGVNWHDQASEKGEKAFANFDDRVVTREGGRSRTSSVIVTPPAADDSVLLEASSPALADTQHSENVDVEGDDNFGGDMETTPLSSVPFKPLDAFTGEVIAEGDDASSSPLPSPVTEGGKVYSPSMPAHEDEDSTDGQALSKPVREHPSGPVTAKRFMHASDVESDEDGDSLYSDREDEIKAMKDEYAQKNQSSGNKDDVEEGSDGDVDNVADEF